MKRTHVILAVPLLTLVACGSDSGMFTLSTGTYALSSTRAVAPDDCNLGTAFPDGTPIQIAVSGSNATFAFGTVDASRNPVCTIQGNIINSASKTYDVNDNDPSLPPAQRVDCVETFTVTASGTLVANDQLQGTLLQSSQPKSGSACTAQALGYRAYPCSSTLSFTAKKR